MSETAQINAPEVGVNVQPVADTLDQQVEAKVNTSAPTIENNVPQMPEMELYLDDPEIQNLRAQCPVPDENLAWLRADIREHGCTDSIKYYILDNGQNMVLDGYNRIEICNSENPQIPYNTQELNFDNREEAVNWFIDSQLKRRNLTEFQKAFLNGKRYKAEKQQHGGDRRSSGHSGHLKNASKIAEETKSSTRTLRRHEGFVQAIDKLSDVVGPKFTQKILAEQTPLSMKAITSLANKQPDEIKAIADKINNGKKPKPNEPSKDEQFFKFDRLQQTGWTILKDIDKITDTSEVDFEKVLKTATDIVEAIKRIQQNSEADPNDCPRQ